MPGVASLSMDPKIPSYAGGKFPLSTYLADQVRSMLADPARWQALPDQVRDWLEIQKEKSIIPKRDELLVETFPFRKRFFMVMYPFEGRLAHQTLGMLLTRRLERAGAKPMGFVATDYSLAIWAMEDIGMRLKSRRLSLADLLDEDMLGDDLEAWLDESFMLKRTFRNCAVISGLIERRHPGKERPAGRSRSQPILFMTFFAAMSRIISCWKRRGGMRRRDFWTLAVLAIC